MSGLGLEAQRIAVAAHVSQTHATLLAEFTEIESGRKAHRPELARALVEARARGAVLVIAKFDRLARNVAFLSALMNGDVEFRALDLPGATRFHLHIMAAVAEKEATDGSERTKVALAAARARGTRLGTPANLTNLSRRRSLAARRARAADRHRLTIPLVLAWQQAGWTLQRMADALTELRVQLPRPTPGGSGRWQHVQVRRLLTLARHQKQASMSKSTRADTEMRAERSVKSKKSV
jgi:DNA invertase Pin-like site-specific DNA recombinase